MKVLQEDWHGSLLSWQHPETTFEASIVTLLNSDKDGKNMAERRQRWQAALQSLYYALRCGKCTAFYVISSKVTTHAFAESRLGVIWNHMKWCIAFGL